MHIKPEDLVFPPVVWTDDQDGGSVGALQGNIIHIQPQGHAGDPYWTIVHDNSKYGYQRGGRDGERTLDQIKGIAEANTQDRIRSSYESALRTIERIERKFGGTT
mgnify:FL=1